MVVLTFNRKDCILLEFWKNMEGNRFPDNIKKTYCR